MATFLPIITEQTTALFRSLNRIGPIVIDARNPVPLPETPQHAYLLVDQTTPLDIDLVISWLDEGMEKVIVPLAWVKELSGIIPSDRLLLLLDIANVSAVSNTVRDGVSGVVAKTHSIDFDFISSISKFFSGSGIFFLLDSPSSLPTLANIRELRSIGATLVLPESQLTLEVGRAHV